MFDFKRLSALYRLGTTISFKDIQVIFNASKKKHYAVGEHFFEAGDKGREVFFIHKGLVRVYAINDKGEEITTAVISEDHFLANPDTIWFDQPSQFYYQAIEPTQVYGMEYDQLQEIVEKHPEIESRRKYILWKMLQKAYKRINSFVLLSPEERYLEFLEEHKNIINRIPDKYIANILGITPVSLSRIKKRIALKKS